MVVVVVAGVAGIAAVCKGSMEDDTIDFDSVPVPVAEPDPGPVSGILEEGDKSFSLTLTEEDIFCVPSAAAGTDSCGSIPIDTSSVSTFIIKSCSNSFISPPLDSFRIRALW